MSNPEHAPARLTARRKEDAVLLVENGGDWLDRAGLPEISAVEKNWPRGRPTGQALAKPIKECRISAKDEKYLPGSVSPWRR